MEDKINYCNMIVSAYHGVEEIDEYNLKEYTLLNIKKILDDFITNNDVDYNLDEAREKALNTPLKIRLKDALIVLNQMNESQELLHIIKERIRSLND